MTSDYLNTEDINIWVVGCRGHWASESYNEIYAFYFIIHDPTLWTNYNILNYCNNLRNSFSVKIFTPSFVAFS
ncbi:MAG: hypothetical protein Q8L47_02315, partial [bacterium]|nr:hypothetical protein [bacterium]